MNDSTAPEQPKHSAEQAPAESERVPETAAPGGEAAGGSNAEEAPLADAPAADAAAAEAHAAEPAEPPAVAMPDVAAEPAFDPAALLIGEPSAPAAVPESPAAQAPEPDAAAAAPVAEPAPEAAASEAAAPDATAPAAPEAARVADVVTSEPSAKPPAPPDPRAEERKRRVQQAWERVLAAREKGDVVTGAVTAAVKGGLLVDVGGIRGFLPASQVRVPPGTAIETLVKTRVPLKVIDVDQSRRRIVVSHRRAAEEQRRAQRAEVLRSLEVGQVREGVVVRLTDFGAFVDLGGVDGLIPMRELAFERVEKTADVVSVGEKLPVEVLRIDEGGKKISLSRKNALPDPWRDHADALRPGRTIEGKVVGKEPRLQVEIAPGIVGTVRESDADPAQYEIGEAIEVTVRRADRATRRITLSTVHGAAAAPPPPTSGGGFAPLGVELGRRS